MSRWGGLRVYWRYWLGFLAGMLLSTVQYGFYFLHANLPPYFEAVAKIGDYEIATGVALV